MTYLLFASEEGDGWQVEQREMAELLLQDWPDAEIQDSTPADAEADGRGLRWICRISGHEIEAWLNKQGTCLYIDGEFDAVADLASWFRGRMPREVAYSMCDDVYSFHVDIAYEASARDIVDSVTD
ncbi:hypothetical protein AB0B06_36370 [Streptomyces sp. NPDC044989]|uniref:hypothetical protein n=1 Tax=Streptomyces sp. NPDC044989 TaxID=3154336 RepID=UPI0033D5F067